MGDHEVTRNHISNSPPSFQVMSLWPRGARKDGLYRTKCRWGGRPGTLGRCSPNTWRGLQVGCLFEATLAIVGSVPPRAKPPPACRSEPTRPKACSHRAGPEMNRAIDEHIYVSTYKIFVNLF